MSKDPNQRSILDKSSFLQQLSRLYGPDQGTIDSALERYKKLVGEFHRHFQDSDIMLFSTPGRAEIGGNHTDHNSGRVIAASVHLDSIAAAAKTPDNCIAVYSEGYPEPFQVVLDDMQFRAAEAGTTTALVRGIAARFRQLGYSIGGFHAQIMSDVLPGSGLSSSASVEVLIGTILNVLYNESKVTAETLAVIGQYAENEYFRKPCGLMDQIACAVGGIVSIDFLDPQKPVVERVAFDLRAQNYNMLVVHTGGNHADLTEDYAAVPREMKSVAKELGHEVCREIAFEGLMKNMPQLRKAVGDRAVLRAMHFLEENARVALQVEALRRNDLHTFLHLVNESGNSSSRWLQNCFSPQNVAEQGIMLALALTERYLTSIGEGACRVHGGGFAGTIQVFLPATYLSGYVQIMEPIFGENCVCALNVRPVGTFHFAADTV